jgi:hypothetical protein
LSRDAPKAFARDLFQAGGIKHRDASVTVTDQTSLLQGACRRCHPSPPHRQHHRKKFLSERQLIGADPVASQQQPTGKALLKAVSAVAGGGLRDLLVEAVRVSGKVENPDEGEARPIDTTSDISGGQRPRSKRKYF